MGGLISIAISFGIGLAIFGFFVWQFVLVFEYFYRWIFQPSYPRRFPILSFLIVIFFICSFTAILGYGAYQAMNL